MILLFYIWYYILSIILHTESFVKSHLPQEIAFENAQSVYVSYV